MRTEFPPPHSVLSPQSSILGLIADDLTGALDAGAGFARHGLRAILPFSGRPEDAPGADVVLINTDTRDKPDPAIARVEAHAAALRLRDAGVRWVYKKIDSVLRGHPGPELAGVLEAFDGRALVAPAFPAQGRTTRHGVQLLYGRPVEPFGGDLRAALREAADGCDVYDAVSDDDLAIIARQGAQKSYRVWCGTAGLAAHLPAAVGMQPRHGPPRQLPPVEQVLVFAGTNHPSTNTQLDQLREAAPPAIRVVVEGRQHAARHEVVRGVRRAALALKLGQGDSLIMTGGETALIVCRALGAVLIEVI